jgi:hypothetical protein
MYKLTYYKRNEVVAERFFETSKEAWEYVSSVAHLQGHGYYYRQHKTESGATHIDYGSHSNFFELLEIEKDKINILIEDLYAVYKNLRDMPAEDRITFDLDKDFNLGFLRGIRYAIQLAESLVEADSEEDNESL